MSQQHCTFYIVRHGETEWNVKRLYQGISDQPLNTTGEKQAGALAKQFKEIHFDAIFSSDLIRAKRTAEAVALERRMAVMTTELLRERSWGRLEGKSWEEVQKELRGMFDKYDQLTEEEKFKHKFVDDMENYETAIGRFITFLREMSVAYAGKIVLVVCHGGIMRALLIHLGFGTHEELSGLSIKNTGYFILESDGVEFSVKETSGIEKKEK